MSARDHWLLFIVLTFFLLALVQSLLVAETPRTISSAEAEQLFVQQVWPLLSEKCLACHGKGEVRLKNLDLSQRDGALKGGESGKPALVPGKPDESLLYIAVTRKNSELVMPPKESDKLSEEQTIQLRNWIASGAPWPDADRREVLAASTQDKWGDADGVRVATTGGLSAEWTQRKYKRENLWAYQPLRKPPIPQGNKGHPIDAFINQKLKDLGLEAAPLADRRTLIRRATFDLIGLPPTPEEVRAFVRDPQSDVAAFSRIVERLLTSPHYGEQWGLHWLDVVRYADSSGLANDYERPNAWRYRDYVIRSFNQDKPYDQFVREQLAGDELDPRDPEMLIAVGFLRMGPWEQTSMEVAKVSRQRFLDDITETVGQVFLAHPLQCARCHDHKFDPIPTRDYYRIQSVFATTQFAERDAAFLPAENRQGFDEKRYLEQRIARCKDMLAVIEKKEESASRRWHAQRGFDYAPREELLKKGVTEDKIAPRHIGLSTEDFGLERIARKNLTRHKWELDRYEPIAFSVYSGATREFRDVSFRLQLPDEPMKEGQLEVTRILSGGDAFSPTLAVTPGVLSMLPDSNDTLGKTRWNSIPPGTTGRRRAFAEWVASPQNALTARVMVNRIWQYHFGQGIARNPNNFGAMGKKPSHLELLDWLAASFIERRWSVKAIHRLIMSSEAYRRSSIHPNARRVAERDPDSSSYTMFKMRRMEAEELRDSMLRISGELNPETGGIPVRPEINLEAALQPRQIMGTYAPAYEPSPLPRQRHRRSIYAVRIRGLSDPFMEVFNRPGLETSCEARDASTVTPQAFMLLNSQNVQDRALALAAWLQKAGHSRKETVRQAFELLYGRPPSVDESTRCLRHWEAMIARHRKLHFERTAYPREVAREAVEEMSGERFRFIERLDVYDDFVPDLKPEDVPAETRALAEVCLVLLNSNEFVFID